MVVLETVGLVVIDIVCELVPVVDKDEDALVVSVEVTVLVTVCVLVDVCVVEGDVSSQL